MKAYIITIISVSVIAGIISFLFSTNSSVLKRHINFITGLICAIVFITPIASIAKNSLEIKDSVTSIISGISDNDTSLSNKIIVQTSVEKICEGIKNTVINKFSFNENDVSVTATINDKNIEAITIDEIIITLSNDAIWYDDEKIKEYVTDITDCNVFIVRK